MSELFPESHSGGTHHEAGGKKGGKIFGMPAWAAGVSAAGIILVIYLFLKGRASGKAPTGTTPQGTAVSGGAAANYGSYDDPNQVDPNSPTGETYAQEGYTTPSAVDSYLAGFTGGGQTGPVGLSPQGLPPPSTNTQWASLAADYLIGQGDDPTLVSNALNDYINGTVLSTAEQAIVKIAIQTFGEPPGGVTPINTGTNPPPGVQSGPAVQPRPPVPSPLPVPDQRVPPPAPAIGPPAPAPTSQRTYTVESGDSLWAIAQRFYGNGALYPRIYNANRGVIGSNPNLIYPGEVLVIP